MSQRKVSQRVYALSSGSYSDDYCVNAVFATREAAQAVVDVNGFFEIEEYEVYTSASLRTFYSIWVGRSEADRWGPPTSVIEGGFFLWEQSRLVWPWDEADKGGRPNVRLNLGPRQRCFMVDGYDEEGVRKSVYDRITQVKAKEAGIA